MSDSVNIEGVDISKELAQRSVLTANALLAVARTMAEDNPALYLLGTAIGIVLDNGATFEEVVEHARTVYSFAQHKTKIERLLGKGPNLQVVPDPFPAFSSHEEPTKP